MVSPGIVSTTFGFGVWLFGFVAKTAFDTRPVFLKPCESWLLTVGSKFGYQIVYNFPDIYSIPASLVV